MHEALRDFFSSELFMPHGHCYLWNPPLLWLQVGSNGLIALAYIAISSALAYLVYRIRDIPFKVLYLAFGVFIISCGVTHLFDIVVIWRPVYWLDGAIRALTALASVGTALALPPLIPKVIALAKGAQAAHTRGIALETAVKDLESMYEKARELERLKTAFFANASHELRTPLSLILGPLEHLTEATNLTSDQRRQLDMALRNAVALHKHVDDLLDVAKLEAGHLKAHYTLGDLAVLVRQAAAHFESLAQERAIIFQVDAPEPLTAEFDPDKVQRVVINLLSNAFKFTPAAGRITCRVATSRDFEGRLTIEVEDSGPGIPEAERGVIFDRFRQVEGCSSHRAGGTGLGLAIVKELTELHEGGVSVHTSSFGGALFRVVLPRRLGPASQQTPAPGAEADAEMPVAPPPATAASQAVAMLRAHGRAGPSPKGSDAQTGHILVVEDNPDMQRFIVDALSGRYAVAYAANGQAGLEAARAAPPDAIVSDMMMPLMSGDAMLAQLRAEPPLKEVPVLFLTARADAMHRVRMLRAGAQDYLHKPFSAEELEARVTNLVALKRVRDLLRRELDSQATDIEHLARELAERKQQLHAALRNTREAQEHAERISNFRSNFLSLVSHEMRTPLTVMRIQAERLRRRRDTLPSECIPIIEQLLASQERLSQLLLSLLQQSQSERGELRAKLELVDPGALAQSVVADLRADAEEHRIDIRAHLPNVSLPPLKSDPKLLRLLLNNLVGNAIKFTGEGGHVELTAVVRASDVVLSVSDSGPGIAPEHHDRIFEPFVHLEPIAHKHTPGAGLGLALVKDVAGILGARVELSSDAGRGSTFSVILHTAEPCA
jgi:signal transduction histidine kinase